MTKLIVIPSNLNIKNMNADAFLFGIKGMSVNMPIYYSIDELKETFTYLKENNKEIFISLNKNMHNKDLEELKNLLISLSGFDIKGIFYYDVAVLKIVKDLKLNIPLVWSAEHLTTNYSTINFWQKYGIDYVHISSEITKDEILEIKNNTSVKMIVNVLGYLPMFVSDRHLISNYLETFNLKDKSNMYYLEKENELYPIIDNELGTNIYSSKYLNAYKEYLEFIDDEIEYVLLNSFLIEDEIFENIIDIFKSKDAYSEDKINNLLCKTDKAFLYQETIYKVKKS